MMINILQDVACSFARCIFAGRPIEREIINLFSSLADRCVLFEIFEKKGQTFCRLAGGIPPEKHSIGYESRIIEHPDINEVFLRQKTLLIIDPVQDSLTNYFIEIILGADIREIIYLPLEERGKVVGIVVVDVCDKNIFDEERMILLEGLRREICKVLDDKTIFVDTHEGWNLLSTIAPRATHNHSAFQIIPPERAVVN